MAKLLWVAGNASLRRGMAGTSGPSFRELSRAIPRGRFVELETGHFTAMASPELVIPVITRFLAETR